MRHNQPKTPVVIPITLAICLLPLAFIGLDFSDMGYHFINQSNLEYFPILLRTTAYYWLSDSIPGIFISLFKLPLVIFRLLGILIWLANAVLCFRLTHKLIQYFSGVSPSLKTLGFCVLPAVLFSMKPTPTPLVIPDYYTIPIPFLVFLLIQLVPTKDRIIRNSQLFSIISVLFILPFLRWPLLLVSIFGYCFLIFFSPKLRWKQRLPISLFFVMQILFLGVYKFRFLDLFLAKDSMPTGYLLGILSIYQSELVLLKSNLIVILVAITGFILLRRKKVFLQIYMHILVGFFTYLFFKNFEFGPQSPQSTLMSYLTFHLLFASSILIFFLFVKSKTKLSLSMPFLLVLLSFPFLYFVGTNTGLRKSGYLAFLALTPTFYVLVTHYVNKRERFSALFLLNVLALTFLYSNVYRDSVAKIRTSPRLLFDSVLGVVLTNELYATAIEDFKTLVATQAQFSNPFLIFPNTPLLYAYVKKYNIDMVWLEIKPDLQLYVQNICADKHYTVIFSKISLVEMGDSDHLIYSDTKIADSLIKNCHYIVTRQSKFFQVLQSAN